MDKPNNSKRAIKGTITKMETFVEESGNHTPRKLDIKLKRVQEMNRKIDELKDLYYDIKDINESKLQVIEADIQCMEDRLEELKTHINAILEIEKLTSESARDIRTMTDILSKNIRALKLLGFERNNLSDLILLNIILKKIDRETRKQFEQFIDSNQIPELDTFIMFLEKRSQTIDSINRSTPITHKQKQVSFHKGSFDKFEEKSYCGLVINAEINSDNLNQQMQVFWEIVKVDESSIEHCLEQEICETQYQNTHYRTEEGRYVVQLPLKKDPYCLETLGSQIRKWDEPLSNTIAKEWNDFVSTLPVIQNIHVPRLVIGKDRIIIHGFVDASTAACGAVLYAQSISEDDVSTRLLCSKSRVAPVKPITIPRLELCACVLLSQPLEKVLHSLTLPIQQIMLWTDFNIVLSWIQRSPEQLKTFIGNRIKIIQRLTQNCQWNHVSFNENPADLISGGLNASDISSKQLWWHDLDFLREELEANPIDFERITSDSDYLKELKPANVLLTSCKFSLIDNLSKRSNNYTKLLHILSYIFRFLHNSRNPSVKSSGQLDYSEVNEAELCLIKNLQASAFQEEIEFLAKSSCNSKKGKLFSLNPFLDGNQILRVGGRLQNSDLTYSQKHPAILPADHLLTKLVMQTNLWDLYLDRESKPKFFPFLHTGIDYCGPFFIRYKHQRKGTYQKIYVAIFVCLASKAVHLEIVSDLSTDAFFATLKRFVVRRGKCATISSDNAKNFVGANRELKRLHNLLKFPEEKLPSYLSCEGISWNCMPPREPNFGGL
ncbi:integrase catalytic domain-containing protein [Trichonephila clavipes]|nr:integrase catalytic domain-containing protein [Trichonephila clavipes]